MKTPEYMNTSWSGLATKRPAQTDLCGKPHTCPVGSNDGTEVHLKRFPLT